MTLKYLYQRDDLVADFVARMTPQVGELGFDKCKTIGVLNADNELIAGMVYQHLSPRARIMEISCAAIPGAPWLTRSTLRIMYNYPFEQCRAQMVAHKVLASDSRLLRQLAVIGCMHITLPRLFGRDTDGVVCLLTDEAWAENKILRRCRMPAELRKAA